MSGSAELNHCYLSAVSVFLKFLFRVSDYSTLAFTSFTAYLAESQFSNNFNCFADNKEYFSDCSHSFHFLSIIYCAACLWFWPDWRIIFSQCTVSGQNQDFDNIDFSVKLTHLFCTSLFLSFFCRVLTIIYCSAFHRFWPFRNIYLTKHFRRIRLSVRSPLCKRDCAVSERFGADFFEEKNRFAEKSCYSRVFITSRIFFMIWGIDKINILW